MSRSTDDTIKAFPDGAVLVDYGPMRMRISVFDQGKPLPEMAKEGARLAIRVLQDLAQFLPVIKKKAHEVEMEEALPDVVRRMVEATKMMEEPDLTPLAAVAGAASDVVADFLVSRGGTKIIVDNGGDVAIRLREGEVARVGIKTEINAKNPSYALAIDATMRVEGVATSGFGGRSFTKGIASAVTVLSGSASLSDAAATVIGNFTNAEDPNITRDLAERIYPDTDIIGEWVTIHVGNLSREKIEEALNNGLSKAYSLCKKGFIKGALITLKDRLVFTDFLRNRLIEL
jgi:ApbE superfamily uncharacterized protein (UPF0280 family)